MDFPIITKEFKVFIKGLLKRGDLSEREISKYTDGSAMRIFRTAFIHPSYSSKFNYELLELLGDITLNASIVYYILARYPNITNVGYFSHVKARLVGKKFLGKMAKKYGFFRHILYSKEVFEILMNEPTKRMFRDIMEDTFEAFIGALGKVILREETYGRFNAISYKIIESFLDGMKIDPYDYRLYYDPISRLTEIYNSRKWNARKLWTYEDLGDGKCTVTLTAPLDRHSYLTKKRRYPVKVVMTGYGKSEIKKNVARKMMRILRDDFAITGVVPDYAKENTWRGMQKY